MRRVWKKVLTVGLCASMLVMMACKAETQEDNSNAKVENAGDTGNTGAVNRTEETDKEEKEPGETGNEETTREPVKVVSVKRTIDYGKKQEARSFEGSAAAESELYVAPIEGLTDEFIRGVDISSYIVEKDSGVVYKDFKGNELDDAGFFNFLADSGVNWVRIRVWNKPYDKNGMGFGGGNNDIEKAVAMGKLATNAGMRVLIDFHYSDFWADPAKQFSPSEWAHITLADKTTKIAEFTTSCLNKLKNADVDVGMVQVGNETNNGMAGESDSERVYTLMKSACDAIRAFSKDIKIAVHYANPEKSGFSDYAGHLIDAGVDYDIFGASYYPFWHGSIDKLQQTLTTIRETYNKDVMVMETSYVYTFEDGDGFANSVGEDTSGVEFTYEVSVQGQANEVRDVMATVNAVGGLGVFYWEPAWLPVKVCDQSSSDAAAVYESNRLVWEEQGSGWAASYAQKYDPKDAGVYYGGASWDNQALFAFDGTPLESINVFKYVFGGTTAEKVISAVPDMTFESGIGKAMQMPEQVAATMIDGSEEMIPVVWNADEVAAAEAAGVGAYTIHGTATGGGKDYEITCTLEIKKVNYIKNAGFEDALMSMWSIKGEGIGRVEDNNKHSGANSLKFYSEKAVEYTVEQTVEYIPAGTYELAAFLQGGDAGSNAVFELFIKVNGEEFKASTGVTSWQKWDNPIVTGIVVPEDAEVIVGVRARAAAKAWGAWDDFTLYEIDY